MKLITSVTYCEPKKTQYAICNVSCRTASLSHSFRVKADHCATTPCMFSIFYYAFALLFWFECFLILAPTFFCHASLCWKSTGYNHFTVSHKSPSQHSLIIIHIHIPAVFLIHTRSRQSQQRPLRSHLLYVWPYLTEIMSNRI